MKIDEFEVAYARFNAQKTLLALDPSEFQQATFGTLTATQDRTRLDPYYNRILGVTTESLGDLQDAIAWIRLGTGRDQNIRIDVGSGVDSWALRDLGFRSDRSLVWLWASPTGDDQARDDTTAAGTQVRPLTPQDWDALKQLLEHHGPISGRRWREQRYRYCSDTFRWFGVFDGDQLVSAASAWTTGDVTIFGSALTLPAFRERGYHLHLLEERLRLTDGWAFVDVEPDTTSHRNCLRAGFDELEQREIWIRDPLH